MSRSRRAFKKQVAELSPRITTLAYYLLGDRARAEDVLQDVLVRWWKQRSRINGDPTGWVLRVTRNACIDSMRRVRDRREAEMVTEPASHGADPEREAMNGDFRAELVRALTTVPEPQRSIVVLREIQGFSYDEIAKTLELSIDQVRVYLHRGRRRLRRAMSEYMHSDGSQTRSSEEDECVVMTLNG